MILSRDSIALPERNPSVLVWDDERMKMCGRALVNGVPPEVPLPATPRVLALGPP